MKLTYSEQLRHPNWQRRRLERLNAVNFACESCYEREKTLHVHHRRYIKGRMAWEYDDEELAVLCEDCHADEHDARSRLDAILSRMSVSDIMEMTGYAEGLSLRRSCGDSTDLFRADSGEYALGFGYALGLNTHEAMDLFEDADPVPANILWQRMLDLKKKAAR